MKLEKKPGDQVTKRLECSMKHKSSLAEVEGLTKIFFFFFFKFHITKTKQEKLQ